MENVLAAIITYNPDIALLKRTIGLMRGQVGYIAVYDNHSKNADEISAAASEYENVIFVGNPENLGLPVNYNRAAALAKEKNCDWLMILDQDSVLPDDIVERLSAYFGDKRNAIVCPRFRDVNLYSEAEFEALKPKEPYTKLEKCISSASVNRVSTILELGGFDEKLFIDQVDYDYCKNVRDHGYRIIQVNDCVIDHSIGKSKFVRFLGMKLVAYNHSPVRKYYFFRNRVYYARKYHITPLNNIRFFTSLVKHFIALFYEEDRSVKIKNAWKGIRDGFKL